MMKKIFSISIIFLLLVSFSKISFSQTDSSVHHFEVNGYVKNLQTFLFTDNTDTVFYSSLFHHRLNISYTLKNHLKISFGARNRIFIGEQVKQNLLFENMMEQDPGYFDLAFVPVSQYSWSWVLNVDRANIAWFTKKTMLRIGRQRINWGINLTWNPNDIFNTYNFLDFDYEERPGIDAGLFNYNFGKKGELDIAIVPAKTDSSWRGAIRYNFNTHGYDFQFIGGLFQKDIVAGIGWAGNISQAGWKGETSLFNNSKNINDSSVAVSISSGIDYVFKSGLYVSSSFLYNSAAPDKFNNIGELTQAELSPKMLMPLKWSFLLLTTKNFTPLLNGNLSLVYSPKINLVLLLPSVSYSIANNWDLDFVWQSYFADYSSASFRNLANSINLRVKWSY